MRLVRLFIAILILIIIVGILLAGALILFIDPNKIKPALITEIHKQTGYDVTIEGDLGWTIYPVMGIKIKHMILVVPKTNAAFLDLHDVSLATNAKDLLHGLQTWQSKVYIAEATVAKVHLYDMHIDVAGTKNTLTLNPITAKLYGGDLKAVVHGRDFNLIPKWDMSLQAANVQVAGLLTDVLGPDSNIKMMGPLRFDLTCETMGKDRVSVLSHLKGSSFFEIKPGQVQGIDFNYLVQSADALIHQQNIPVSANINQTNFDSLTGTVNIVDGIGTTNNLLLTTPAFMVKGNGTLNLLSAQLAMAVQVESQETIKTGFKIPILLSGKVDHLKVTLDTQEIEKLLARQELEKVKKKVAKEIEEHVPGAGQFLNKLLGQ